MGRPVVMLLSEGQMSDYKGAHLENKGIKPCIPPKKNRKIQIKYDKTLYKQRHKVENMFENSKTGAASQRDMTDAHTPSFQPYASPQL